MAPKFDDLINSIGVGEDGVTTAYPDTFLDDMRGAYAEDMQIPDARIQVLESDLATATAQVTQLMAENYQLIKAVGASSAVEGDGDDDAGDGDDGDDDADVTTDDLFGDDTDDDK